MQVRQRVSFPRHSMSIKLKNCLWFAAAYISYASATCSANQLIRDDFTTSAPNEDVNAGINGSGRQSGILADTKYRQGFGSTVGGATQVNGSVSNESSGTTTKVTLEKLRLGGSLDTASSVSLDHNFIENPGIGNYLSIRFDVDPVIGNLGTSADWAAVTLGASDNALFGNSGAGARGQFITSSAAHYGVLFRDNGSYQIWDGNILSASRTYDASPTAPSTHSIELRITGLIDGNPWDGINNTRIEFYSDNSPAPIHTFTKTGGYLNNYITLQGYNGGASLSVHEFDNFQAAIVPEPSSLLLSLCGDAGFFSRRRRLGQGTRRV